MREIKRAALVLVCVHFVAGCGGGGGSDGASSTAEKTQGIYGGIASTGEPLAAFVLADGRFWIYYQSQSIGDSQRGFVYGVGAEDGTAFTAPGATDVHFEPPAIVPSSLNATVQAQSRLNGTLHFNGQDAAFNAFYDEPPLMSDISGTYHTTFSALTNGVETFTLHGNLTISSSGVISGMIGEGCTVSGSAKPRGDINVHSLLLSFIGTVCPMNVSLDGIAYFGRLSAPTSSTRQITGFSTSAAGDVGFLVSAVAF